MTTASAEELKSHGNKAFSAGQFQEAIDFFTQAIEADSSNHVRASFPKCRQSTKLIIL